MKEKRLNQTVIVSETGQSIFQQSVVAGAHHFWADEPQDMGGEDTGPAPFDFLMAGLGACTAMTIRMYARHKKIKLDKIEVVLTYTKIEVDGKSRDHIQREIVLVGALTEEQREKLLLIANKCPVHKAIEGNLLVSSKLA
jgi:putative redox protein